MKIFFIFLFPIVALLSSCVTAEPKEADPNFLGNFDPVKLGTYMTVQDTFFSGIKPRELTLFFVPRSNTVEMYFSDTINKAAMVLFPESRQFLIESGETYLSLYEEGKLTEREPDKKNAFGSAKVSLSWGLAGLGRNTDTDMTANYQYLEQGKPYFLIALVSNQDKKDSAASSPRIKLYFSPTQLNQFLDILKQEYLLSIIKEKEKEAYAFDIPVPPEQF